MSHDADECDVGTTSTVVGWDCHIDTQESAVPALILPRSFAPMLQRLSSVFTEDSFDNFCVLTAGFLHALGAPKLTDALRAAGNTAVKQYCAYYRFFSRARWCQDQLGLAIASGIVRFRDSLEVDLVLDDVFVEHKGKKIALAGMHANPLLKASNGRRRTSYGHVFVVLAIHITVPWTKTGWALPVLFRLYQPPSRGGRADAPSDRRRALERRRKGKSKRARVRKTDRRRRGQRLVPCAARPETSAPDRQVLPKKTELGAELVLLLARHFADNRFIVAADSLYNGKTVLHAVCSQVDHVDFVTRGRKDAALYALPPPRRRGQRGRNRVKGERLDNPQTFAACHPEAFRDVIVPMYGRQVPLRVASYTGMAYRSLPGRLLRYIIVIDPDGIYQPTYLLCTDTAMDVVAALTAYAQRWTIERTFQDSKQQLGLGASQMQLPNSVRRQGPFRMLLYSLVVLWFIEEGHAHAVGRDDPWYRRTGRPSFRDMLAAWRRQSWAEAFEPHRPDSWPHAFAEYADRVLAAA